MRRKEIIKLGFIFLILGICIWRIYPPEKNIRLGLDLKGGMQLTLQVEGKKGQKIGATTNRALEVIRNRIDALGVSEPIIQKVGQDRIFIQLPGVVDPKRAEKIIGQTALLEFKMVVEDEKLLREALNGNIPPDYQLSYLYEKDESGIKRPTTPFLLKKEVSLTGAGLKDARMGFEPNGLPEVSIEFNSAGAKKFAKVTAENVGKRLAILLDGNIQSAPNIQEKISSGKARITGRFTQEETRDLAIVLQAGALPAKLSILERNVVGPSLGKDSIQKGIRSGLYGAIAVVFFMVIYYAASGLLADFALFFNILIILSLLVYFKGTLTLPGLAGIALTIGMAVDANVLIFERIREELKTGKTIRTALNSGYERALVTVIDSNLTTVIAGVVLFLFGTGMIKGFGLTLTLGILANIFTAVFVTRSIFEFILFRFPIKRLSI